MAKDKEEMDDRVEIDCPLCGSNATYGNGGISCSNPSCPNY